MFEVGDRVQCRHPELTEYESWATVVMVDDSGWLWVTWDQPHPRDGYQSGGWNPGHFTRHEPVRVRRLGRVGVQSDTNLPLRAQVS